MSRRLAILAAGLLLAGPAQAAPSPSAQLKDGRDAFAIDLPSDCRLETRGLTIDFEVFYVTCGTVTYGGLYAGNAPDRSVPRSRILKTAGVNWPTDIQVWSLEVKGDQARADAIAASVRLSPMAGGAAGGAAR